MLVHCAQGEILHLDIINVKLNSSCLANVGVSRSVSIVIAYLIKAEVSHGDTGWRVLSADRHAWQRMTLRDAYDLVRTKRPLSRPNVGFLKQLAALELRVHGTSTMQT